ncbi:hypothetical protein GWK47_027526 [Chionoecetes opilio]|uniref:Uncharacterized protein n=1 Tax=Chionoecetes opilio TaxID=41210 RepID=A0A8J8W9A1_CHIOP|nr:hypothetical protein GWK47_027526 [Chionoecetes opilio]
MADYPDYWDQVDLENEIDAQGIVGRGRGRRRVVTDRMNPFTAMSDAEFFDRFRLKKASMSDLIEEIRDQLPAANDLRAYQILKKSTCWVLVVVVVLLVVVVVVVLVVLVMVMMVVVVLVVVVLKVKVHGGWRVSWEEPRELFISDNCVMEETGCWR